MLGLYQACYFAAIARTGVAVATLITLCTAPVLVAILSGVLGREWPTRATLLALACALAGTALLVAGRPMAGSRASLLGVFLALGSASGYAIVTLCGRAIAGRTHPLQVNAIAFAAGAILVFALALPNGLVVTYPTTGWLALGYLGLVPTALAYGLFLAGMSTIPATVATTPPPPPPPPPPPRHDPPPRHGRQHHHPDRAADGDDSRAVALRRAAWSGWATWGCAAPRGARAPIAVGLVQMGQCCRPRSRRSSS